jgi:hypothetical protein
MTSSWRLSSPSHSGSRTSLSATDRVTAMEPLARPKRLPAGESCSGT